MMPHDDGPDVKWAGHIHLLKLYLISKTSFPLLGKYERKESMKEKWLSFL